MQPNIELSEYTPHFSLHILEFVAKAPPLWLVLQFLELK